MKNRKHMYNIKDKHYTLIDIASGDMVKIDPDDLIEHDDELYFKTDGRYTDLHPHYKRYKDTEAFTTDKGNIIVREFSEDIIPLVKSTIDKMNEHNDNKFLIEQIRHESTRNKIRAINEWLNNNQQKTL